MTDRFFKRYTSTCLAVVALAIALLWAVGCDTRPRECVRWGETETQIHLHRVGKVPHCLEWRTP